MLLSRFGDQFRKQEWFTVVLEIIVVVLGIMIGLQATDWNQSRLDRREELTYLQALEADLKASREQLLFTVKGYDEILAALIRLAEISDQPEEEPITDNIDELIWQGLWDLSFLEEHMNVYSDLESSGRMNLIGSQELRLALAELNSNLKRFGKTEHDVLQVQNLHVDGYLADHVAMRTFVLYSKNGKGLPQSPVSTPFNYRAFLTTQETQNRITMKYIAASGAKSGLLELEIKLGKVQELLQQRRQELGI